MTSKLVYTVKDGSTAGQTYEGFKGAYNRTMAHPRVLACVMFDGDVDLYRLDQENVDLAVEELKRMYRAMHCTNVRVAVYRREKIVEEDHEEHNHNE